MLIEWVLRGDDTRGYFAREFPKVFEKSLDEAWDDWVDFERGFQQANLDSIRQYPTTPYRDISPRALAEEHGGEILSWTPAEEVKE